MTDATCFCPTCGSASAGGNFCNTCGAPLTARSCRACEAPLDARARFCHKCGEPVGGVVPRHSERVAWWVAGIACVAFAGSIAWYVVKDAPTPVTPDMANVGSGGLATQAPDISQMTPRERFDRLFDRVTRATESGDTTQVQQFVPMALGAYAMLDTVDVDARFHAAVLHFTVGDLDAALALADTIQAAAPTHLFAPLLRGSVALAQNDSTLLLQSYREFLANYGAEMQARREEYLDHQQVIDEFRTRALEAVR